MKINIGKRLFKKLKKIFLLYIIIQSSFGNDKLKIINADYLESYKKNNQTIQKLHGNVILQNNEIMLYTEDATFYKDINQFHLVNGVKMINNLDTLKCEKIIHYNLDNSYLKAIGKITFFQPNQKIYCDSLFYWPDLDSSIAYSNVKMIQKNTTITSEKLSFWKTSGYRGSSFIANGDCFIKENNKSINANEIIYNDSTQLMSLIDNCNINEINKGISGDEIFIQYLDS